MSDARLNLSLAKASFSNPARMIKKLVLLNFQVHFYYECFHVNIDIKSSCKYKSHWNISYIRFRVRLLE